MEHEGLALLDAILNTGSLGVVLYIAWRLLNLLERVLLIVVEHEFDDEEK